MVLPVSLIIFISDYFFRKPRTPTVKRWSSRGWMLPASCPGLCPCQRTLQPTRRCWRGCPRSQARGRHSPSPPGLCPPASSRPPPWPSTRCPRCWPRYLNSRRSEPVCSASSSPRVRNLSLRSFLPRAFWETLTSTETAQTRQLTVRYFFFSFKCIFWILVWFFHIIQFPICSYITGAFFFTFI